MTGAVSRRSLLPEGSRLSSSRKRGLRFWRHRGFVLAEALIVLLIVSLGMAMAVPSLSDWQEERQLDLAAEELASAIRVWKCRGADVLFLCAGRRSRLVFHKKGHDDDPPERLVS